MKLAAESGAAVHRGPRTSLVGRCLGEFELTGELGAGSFGVIYRAEQVGLRRPAVVRILRPRAAEKGTLDLRFLREARLASTLDHPYAAHVYAFGIEPDGLMWIAMELVRGTPLSEMLRAGPLPLSTFVPFLERLCEVVQTAHEHGIVHRDIKPANVMVITRAGALLPKLIDLGIAKEAPNSPVLAEGDEFYKQALFTVRSRLPSIPPDALDQSIVLAGDSDIHRAASSSPGGSSGSSAESENGSGAPFEPLTKEGDLVGSPEYMAPEQWTSADQVDFHCDIYSLGVLAYEAVAGRRPFHGTYRELAGEHIGARVPPLPDALPPALYDALSHAMAKDPKERPASAVEFAREFSKASGLEAPPLVLRRLGRDVAEDALREFPQPLAEAVEELEGASATYQSLDAAERLVRGIVRFMAVIALAAWQSDHPAQPPSNIAGVLLATLRQRRLNDEEWFELARALVQPYRSRPDAHPVPPLVRALTENSPVALLLASLLARHAARGASALPAEGAAAEEAEIVLDEITRLLRELTFLSDYLLAVVGEGGGAELWMGVRRRHRLTHAVPRASGASGAWDVGTPLLLCGGERVLNLAPAVRVAKPSANAEPELFVLDGQGRSGLLLVALPRGFEMSSEVATTWLRRMCAVSDDAEPALPVLEAPYRGLAPLTARDGDVFFGREREVEAFLNRLRAEPFLVVTGASGAGKSSFLRAGVVPALGPTHRSIVLRPGTTPLATLLAKFAHLGIRTDGLRSDSDPRDVASRVHAVAQERGEIFVFFIDQFEETFTLLPAAEERAAFSAWLSAIAQSAADPARVVLALRDDFLKNAQQEAALRPRLEHALAMLGTPDAAGLRQILTEPARRAGFSFETSALVDEMVSSVAGRPGALALLAFAASKLWEQRNAESHTLERAAYEKMGGVVGALANHAEGVLAAMALRQRPLVRELFRRLVTADGTRALAEEVELLAALGGDETARAVLDRLVDGRLLVVRDGEGARTTVEVIHESLLSSWTRLVHWRQEDEAGNRVLDQLRVAAQQWDSRGRPRSLLWRDELLEDYGRFRSHDARVLTAREDAFARASVADRDRARRLRLVSVALLAAAAVGTSYVAWQQSLAKRAAEKATLRAEQANHFAEQAAVREHEEALRVRDAARLAAARNGANDPTTQLALLRDVEAKDPPPGWDVETRAALHAGIASAVYAGHVGPVASVVFSPDGQSIVSGGADSTVRVWRADGSGSVRVFRGHEGGVSGVAVSGDGARIVSASKDGTVRVWKADGSGDAVVLRGHAAGVRSVAFSPDGRLVASASADTTVRVWDADGSGEPLVLRGHTLAVTAVAFSPDGRHIASASADKTVRVWNADGSGTPLVLRGHTGVVLGLSYSPDGQRLATSSWDRTIRVWDVTGRSRAVLSGHDGPTLGVAFSPDGRKIASSSLDQTVRVWSADGSGKPRAFRGHADGVLAVAFSPDGAKIVTGGVEGEVRVWRVDLPEDPRELDTSDVLEDVALSPDGRFLATPSADSTVHVWNTDGSGLAVVLRGHTGQGFGVAFSPDGRRVASGSFDQTVCLWDLDRPTKPNVFRGHTSDTDSVAFSPDGRLLASGSADHTVRVWDTTNPSAPARVVFRGHTDAVSGVAFGPDGHHIVSGSWDKTVRVWDTEGSREPVVLVGHSDRIYGVAFSPDGKRVASASNDKTVRIWNADGSGEPLVLHGHSAGVNTVAFRPDGEMVASGASDNEIRLWHVVDDAAPGSTGALLAEEPTVVSGNNPVVFSADGRSLYGRRDDGKMVIYRDTAPLVPDDPRLWQATNLCVPAEKQVALLGITDDVARDLHARCLERVARAVTK